MDITPLLVNAQSADPAVRNQAEEAIQQLQQGDQCAPFWVSCAGELANNDKPTEVRQLAGLILKNALDAKDDARRKHLQEKWVALPAEVKQQVKVFLLTTLACPVKIAAHTAAQVSLITSNQIYSFVDPCSFAEADQACVETSAIGYEGGFLLNARPYGDHVFLPPSPSFHVKNYLMQRVEFCRIFENTCRLKFSK